MSDRPACYPPPSTALSARTAADRAPLLDVLTSPVPQGVFDSPVDGRHVLCLHLGTPVPVSYRADGHQRSGVRLHGQYCVVPAGSSTRWVLSQPARSLLLRLTPSLWQDTAQSTHARGAGLAPAIHVRDPQIERIGWMMQAEEHDAYPSGRLFADSLATALAARLLTLQSRRPPHDDTRGRALPAWRLRRVQEYVEAHLDEPLSLLELAAVAGYSGSHFKALFKQATGVAVHQYVLQRRVERARVLLLQGGQRIGDIALAAGFSHASHMARCLRRVLGQSPSELMRDAADAGRIVH
ncbi:AraC family transcriptional regulator [Lysobacter sp. 5GHs7-4]|uniref:AraC family transcriptional regulator n=1 Tax=Lysobacter sp. 5GHs7-4 TaxID=2904253 RepID=UPI001E2DFE63|nr:AraC family transcriptional regulator [Lysobacter sp. 5GHs7-4]UHQ23827.1 AraC family transcriptional regulator [Lysobacter sp. 5GHs7-4]